MALSIFEDKTIQPSEEDVTQVLGEAKLLWDSIKNHITSTYGVMSEEWKNYGKESGWTLQLKLKRRTLLYLFPQSGHFIVQFVFGEKAVTQSLNSDLSEGIKKSISEAKPYVEGRSFRMDVKTLADLSEINKLIQIKESC